MQQNGAQIFVSFFEKNTAASRKNRHSKRALAEYIWPKGKTPGSNRGRRSKTAICIYGLKEKIRA